MYVALLIWQLVSAGPAVGDCALPQETVEPPGGALPRDPVLYVFSPGSIGYRGQGVLRVELDGLDAPFVSERVVDAPAFAVWRVTVDVDHTATMSVFLAGWAQERRLDYWIDPSWRRATPGAAPAVASEYRSNRWTCGFTEALYLLPAIDAPTYRVEWARSHAAFARGERYELLFPRAQDDYWFGSRSDEPPEIGLGDLDCFGRTFQLPLGPLYLQVTPLYPDGSEGPPMEVNPPDVAPTVAATHSRCNRRSFIFGRAYGPFLLVLGGLLGAWFLLRRKRQPSLR